MSKIKIGVIGYSAKSFPIYEAYNKIVSALEKAIHLSAQYNINVGYNEWKQVSKETYNKHGICKVITYPSFEIISGFTDYGIPALTYCVCESKILSDYQIETVGFAPNCALNDNICKVDKQIIVGENYGDESEEFIKYIDILIKVGGGKQSIKEAKLFKQLKPNNLYIEKKLKCYN